jgi:hypothetical protein
LFGTRSDIGPGDAKNGDIGWCSAGWHVRGGIDRLDGLYNVLTACLEITGQVGEAAFNLCDDPAIRGGQSHPASGAAAINRHYMPAIHVTSPPHRPGNAVLRRQSCGHSSATILTNLPYRLTIEMVFLAPNARSTPETEKTHDGRTRLI